MLDWTPQSRSQRRILPRTPKYLFSSLSCSTTFIPTDLTFPLGWGTHPRYYLDQCNHKRSFIACNSSVEHIWQHDKNPHRDTLKSHVQFDLYQILLITKYSFDTGSGRAMAVGWWQPAASFHAAHSLCHESLEPRLTLRYCTHTKGVWKACSTLMKEGVLWSYLQPEKRGERGSVFILCSLVQPCSMPACLLSLWLLPVDKYILLQSISSIFKKTDNTFFNISQGFCKTNYGLYITQNWESK